MSKFVIFSDLKFVITVVTLAVYNLVEQLLVKIVVFAVNFVCLVVNPTFFITKFSNSVFITKKVVFTGLLMNLIFVSIFIGYVNTADVNAKFVNCLVQTCH